MKYYRIIVCAALALIGVSASAQLKLSPLFSDNMVLQQQSRVPIWGTTGRESAQVRVTTSWDSMTYVTKADKNGKWKLNVSTPYAGGPYTITISDPKSSITLNNVLCGEVWLCSGQSNMEMPVEDWGKVKDYEQELAECDYPEIRLINVHKDAAAKAATTFTTVGGDGWQVCSAEPLKKFSAVAYFFGREMQQTLNVPIGLIDCAYAGSCIEAWMSPETLEGLESEHDFIAKGKEVEPKRKNQDPKKPYRADFPSRIFNAMLNPLVPYAVKGVLWYQGETNVRAAQQYRETLPLFINDIRERWNADLPFYIVQISNVRPAQTDPNEVSADSELREVQQFVTSVVPNTYLAVTIDLGEADDIHFKNKQDVGHRLALLASRHTYRKNVDADSPVMEGYTVEKKGIRIRFRNAEGLKTSDGEAVKGFLIAGSDRKFHFADAVIEGNTVFVSCPDVKYPQAVRYAWASNPVCNLVNGAGLPAGSFRTDIWPASTEGKKMMR